MTTITDKLAEAHRLGATGAEPTEEERLLFEAWMRGHCWALCATWNGRQYVSDAEQGGCVDPRAMNTRQLFAAWRDRGALAAYASQQAEPSDARVELPPLPVGEGQVLWNDPATRFGPEPAGKIIDASLAFFDAAQIGDHLFTADQMRDYARAVLQAADAVSAGVAVPGWLPIETAPKDGTLFLCWVEAVQYGENDEGQQYQIDVSQVDFCQWQSHDDAPDGGWFEPCCGHISDHQRVTHWMPLPAAPGSEQKEGANGYVLVPEKALRWLFGEEGEFVCPPERYFRGKPPQFWWRSVFRELIAAPGSEKEAGNG